MNIRPTFFLVASALLLAACSPTPAPVGPPAQGQAPTVPPAAKPTALGTLYHVRFQGAGTPQPSARAGASNLSTQTLNAQTLVGTPDPLGFTGVPLSVSSFTDKVNRVRHIRATFKVTNTSGRSLDNLTFIPVSTADTDGDASNNAAAPTLAGTPFSRIEYFDGSDASARATGLTLGAGRRLDAASGTGVPDLSVSPFKTGIDISQVFPAAPAGLSATALNVGWQVRPSLAPGESANVTFGVDIQNVDPADPKADPYSFDLAFTAAEDSAATAAAGRTIQTGAIRGTVNDSALFGGKLVLVNGVTYPQTSLNASTQVGSSGAVELAVTGTPPSGDFSAAVPPIGDPCTFRGSVSDSSAIFASYAGLLASSAGGDPVATIQETLVAGGSVPGALVARMYAQYPIDLKGKVTCWNRPTTQTYDLHLDAGWNAVEVSGSNGAVVFRNLSPDARSILIVTRRTPGVTALLDDYSTINLKPGERVTRNVKLLQVGAYSGTVKLSTNVPGATVEPGSVNLSPLSSQSLKPAGWQPSTVRLETVQAGGIRAQSLSTAVTFVAAADAPEHNWYDGKDALIVSDADGKELGRTRADVMLVVPGVSATVFNSYGFTGYRGETNSVTVRLSSVNGLDGPVTVSLSGLPDGATVTPQTVNVTPWPAVDVTLQVNVAGTTALGSSTITVVTTPANRAVSANETQFHVLPTRVQLGIGESLLFPATRGFWIVGSYDSVTGATSARRFVDGIFQGSVIFPGSVGYPANQFLAGFGGDLIANNNYSQVQNVFIAHDDDSVDIIASRLTDKIFSAGKAVSDSQKRVWFVEDTFLGSGKLSYLDLSGQVASVDNAISYSNGSTFEISNNGRWIIVRQNNQTGAPIRINTVAETVEILPFNAFGTGDFTVQDDGAIWFTSDPYSYQDRLFSLSTAGIVNEIAGAKASQLVGFDRKDSDILWFSSQDFYTGGVITKLRITDGSQTKYKVLRDGIQTSISSAVTNPQGGVDYIVGEHVYPSDTNYLSHLN